MYFVDHLHQHGIGVILDWVPSHFPDDAHGLAQFDGTHLYEHADPRQGFHPEWKSSIFNYGRHEVRAFLISSALFWLDQLPHRRPARRCASPRCSTSTTRARPASGSRTTTAAARISTAVEFLRDLNQAVYRDFPDTQTIAEESTAWPMVSRPVYVGGLGFGLKWNMGWMHDTLDYFAHGSDVTASYHHDQLTFALWYAFTENFVLPLSHDEVVHGKGSLLGKMPGDDWQQFANLRLLFGYMWAHPGKKLLFMGGEFGQRREWTHDASLEWYVLQYPEHAGMQRWVRDLNRFYRASRRCTSAISIRAGFEWSRCRRRREQRRRLSALALRRGPHAAGRLQLHAGAAPQLSARRAARRLLARSAEQRRDRSTAAAAWAISAASRPRRCPRTAGRHSLTLTLPPLATVIAGADAVTAPRRRRRPPPRGHRERLALRRRRPLRGQALRRRPGDGRGRRLHRRPRSVARAAARAQAGHAQMARIDMVALGNDRWRGAFHGRRHRPLRLHGRRLGRPLRVMAPRSRPPRRAGGHRPRAAGRRRADRGLARRARGADAKALREWAQRIGGDEPVDARRAAALDAALAEIAARHADRSLATTFEPALTLVVDRPRARFSSWYEMFPRSAGDGRHARHVRRRAKRGCPTSRRWASTCCTCRRSIRSARRERKGQQQRAGRIAGRRGSPWAIGAAEGGHTAIHPRARHARGFPPAGRAPRERAASRSRSTSPSNARPIIPTCSAHPEWFRQRPDGTHPVRRESAEEVPGHLSVQLRDRRLARRCGSELHERCSTSGSRKGVRIFRVDNPHTKPFAFWEWLIGGDQARASGRDLPRRGLHAAEGHAPAGQARLHAVVHLLHLAQHQGGADRVFHRARAIGLGATTSGPTAGRTRRTSCPSTLQIGGRPAFIARARAGRHARRELRHLRPRVRAAWSTRRAKPGSEEYLDSEKYELRHWDLRRAPTAWRRFIARVNRIRREQPGAAAGLAPRLPRRSTTTSCSATPSRRRTWRTSVLVGRQSRSAPRAVGLGRRSTSPRWASTPTSRSRCTTC